MENSRVNMAYNKNTANTRVKFQYNGRLILDSANDWSCDAGDFDDRSKNIILIKQ